MKFELTEQTREAIDAYLKQSGRVPGQFLFAGRADGEAHLTGRQLSRLLNHWLMAVGLGSTRSMR